jgi:hypothetical protein
MPERIDGRNAAICRVKDSCGDISEWILHNGVPIRRVILQSRQVTKRCL